MAAFFVIFLPFGSSLVSGKTFPPGFSYHPTHGTTIDGFQGGCMNTIYQDSVKRHDGHPINGDGSNVCLSGFRDTCCPICKDQLETKTVTPCMDCGAEAGEHTGPGESFWEVELQGQHRLTLCGFCREDFAAYHPGWFGLNPSSAVKQRDIKALRQVPAVMEKDGYCNRCGHRQAFLNFLAQIRNRNLQNGHH